MVTIVLALFWFAGSIAWAAGLTSLKDTTDADKYIKNAAICKAPATCKVAKEAGYTALTISLVRKKTLI